MKEDWIECTLGDLLKLKNGFAFKSSKYKNEGIPVLRIGDIQDWNVDIYSAKRIQESNEYDSHIVNKGDILIAMSGATTGKFGIYNSIEKAYQNQRVGNLIPHSENYTNKKYIYYLLYSLKRDIEIGAYGGAQPNISSTKIEALKTKLFPLPIQKAIVKKIESLFSSLDSGIADLKKAQKQLKIYRQAVLKKAFEGELTNTKQNNKEHPDGWKRQTIRETCHNIKVGIVIKPTNFYSKDKKGIKAFRSANVREFRVNDTNWVYFSQEGNNINKRTQVHTGDVLIVRSGYPGTSCAVREKFNNTNAIDILIATPNQEKILPDFLCAFNNSPLGKGLFSRGSQGVAQKHLNVGVYSKLLISYPSIKEQHEILKEIESRLSVCDKVEESIKESLEKAQALRQSILKKAFEGKLLSEEEIAKYKQDKDYEPASVLLEKIKAEKVSPKKKKVE